MTTNTAPATLATMPRAGLALELLAARTTEAEFASVCDGVLGTFNVHLRNARGDFSAAGRTFLAANGQAAAALLVDVLAAFTSAARS